MATKSREHRVDAIAVWRFDETAPRAGSVRQTSDDGGTVDVLQSVIVQSAGPYAARRRSSRSQSPDAGRAERWRKFILDAHAQHLQTTRYSRQRCRFSSIRCMVSPLPVVSEDDLGRLAVVQLEVVSRGPFQHVGELCGPCRLIAGWDDDVRVVGVLAHRVSRHSGDEVSGVTTYAAGPVTDPWTILAVM